MLRVLAVDDEPPALEELLHLLRADPRVERAEGAADATEALRRISQALEAGTDSPDGLDVVFLDIHMPGLSGLDTARLLAGFAKPPAIVFVTAHEGFAVQAFDLNAVDYVLKPVRRERLAEAVRRAGELVGAARPAADRGGPPAPAEASAPLDTGTGPGRAAADDEVVPVELGGVTRFIPVSEITYAEAQGDYARLHTERGTGHLVRIPLSALEERWREHGFVRIHRRYLVALRAVRQLRTDGGTVSVQVGDELLAVSRRSVRELRDLLLRPARGLPPRG
ncbi:LytR/AlgR family response regulator transcription factor [Kitasatospora sp. NPDC089509]|uniref:LytR/AlgR family response regulator transcription factor n=1 Tax=Kitasatospora sp. NPDC089509 TaxID=3364079 RepID=UPI00381A11AF